MLQIHIIACECASEPHEIQIRTFNGPIFTDTYYTITFGVSAYDGNLLRRVRDLLKRELKCEITIMFHREWSEIIVKLLRLCMPQICWIIECYLGMCEVTTEFKVKFNKMPLRPLIDYLIYGRAEIPLSFYIDEDIEINNPEIRGIF